MEFRRIFDIHRLRLYLCSKREDLGFHKQATPRRPGDEPFFYFGVHRSWLSSLLMEHFQFDWTILLASWWLSSPCSTHEVQQQQGWQASPKRRKTGEWSKIAWRWAVRRIEWWQNNDQKWVEWWGPRLLKQHYHRWIFCLLMVSFIK